MKTLRSLRKEVGAPDENRLFVSVRKMLDNGAEVFVQKVLSDGTTLTVYDNGYVLYQTELHMSLFPITGVKGDYLYESQEEGSQERLTENYLESQEWYVRLFMEGNDRVAVNIRKGTEKKVFSYESIGEGWAKLQDRKDGMLQKLDEIAIREYLTDQQYKVFIGAVMYGLSQQQIAEEMGISRSAVKKHYDLALRKIRKADMV